MNLDTFLSEYEDRADDVRRAGFRSFARALSDWLDHLDSEPAIAGALAASESEADFERWYAEGLASVRGMVGSGRLSWSRDRVARLGQYLALFRMLSAEEMAFSDFCASFLWAGGNFDDSVHKIVNELFEPFARDLAKHIRTIWNGGDDEAPASDRVVRLDHNSPQYLETVATLDKLGELVRGLNDFPGSADEQSQIVAELGAGGRLLKATQARVRAVWETVAPALKWISARIADHAIGLLVKAAALGLLMLFGMQIAL